MKKLVVSFVAALVATAALAPLASAQSYPTRPIRLLVGLPPGAVSDINARIIAQAMSESLGQPIVVENKPGAEESLAIEAVREAPADGYTIGMFNFSSLVATPSLNKNVNFDPRKDLAPVSMLGRMSVSLSVNPALPVKTLRELTDYALANPGKLNFASVGALDTLLARLLMKDSGIAMTQVNYKGPVQSMQDVMAGVIQIGINPIGAHIELARSGRVRMLTVFGAERDLGVPDVPTSTESGFPGVRFNGMWLGLFGPGKMSRDRLELIANEVDKALKRADVREKLLTRMLKPESSSPEALGAILRADLEQWGKFATDNGLVQATK